MSKLSDQKWFNGFRVIKGREECYFTPHKGTGTCYDCRFAYNPEQSDSGCRLPYETWRLAVKGIRPSDEMMKEAEDELSAR